MSQSFLRSNLAALKNQNAHLYEQFLSFKTSSNYQTLKSRSGPVSLVHIDEKGIKKQIHSSYDPIDEAMRHLKAINVAESLNFIVLGLGLGYMVDNIVGQVSKYAKIYIFEKDPELLALALREVDLSKILKHPGVKLFINCPPGNLESCLKPEQLNFSLNDYCIVKQQALINLNLEYYGTLLDSIDKYLTESKINFKTQEIHSKLYCDNNFSNFENFNTSPGVNTIKNCLPDTPAIICSAGPSLDKNIQLLKTAKDRFFLIAVGTALKPLLHHDIEPDIVITIDPDEQTINGFDFSTKKYKFCLVYNPDVPSIIPSYYSDRRMAFDSRVYLGQWLNQYNKEKGSLGKISSVAHATLNLASLMNCSPTILVGQDLSFIKKRLHCSKSYYHNKYINKISQLCPLWFWERTKYLKYGSNLTQCVDMFGSKVISTLAMESYSHIFSEYIKNTKQVVNATEGGVPIKGAQNLTLKEALHIYCKKPLHNKLSIKMTPVVVSREASKSYVDLINKQILCLRYISEQLAAYKIKFFKSDAPDIKSKYEFIKEIETLNKYISGNKETALLLQGYNFSGFSEWYRSNTKILMTKDLYPETNCVDAEYERDFKLYTVLTGAVDYLICNLKKTLP